MSAIICMENTSIEIAYIIGSMPMEVADKVFSCTINDKMKFVLVLFYSYLY
jgi:hypothetical protein